MVHHMVIVVDDPATWWVMVHRYRFAVLSSRQASKFLPRLEALQNFYAKRCRFPITSCVPVEPVSLYLHVQAIYLARPRALEARARGYSHVLYRQLFINIIVMSQTA
jgi:hypothetical protein